MHYVYLLHSQRDDEWYVGSTANLKRRFAEHQNGEVTSTRYRRPLSVIFYEAYINKSDAVRRELYLKTDKGKTTIKTTLREYLNKPL